MDKKTFGKHLRDSRKLNRLKQADLAKLVRCTQNAISNWEKGLRLPKPHHLEKLSKALKIPLFFPFSEESNFKALPKKPVLTQEFIKKLNIVTEKELKNYKLRKNLSSLVQTPAPDNVSDENDKIIIFNNVVLFRMNPKLNYFLPIEIEAPYSNGDQVVFHDLKLDKILFARFAIQLGKYYLSNMEAKVYTRIPYWSEGKRYRYIGKIIDVDTAAPEQYRLVTPPKDVYSAVHFSK